MTLQDPLVLVMDKGLGWTTVSEKKVHFGFKAKLLVKTSWEDSPTHFSKVTDKKWRTFLYLLVPSSGLFFNFWGSGSAI